MPGQTDRLLLIAVYEFATAGFLFLASCILLPILLLTTPFVSDTVSSFFLRFLLIGLAVIVLFGLGLASIAVGIGLLARRQWARVAAMVLAAIALLGFPLWTVAGLLILWYLSTHEARRAFRTQPAVIRTYSFGRWEAPFIPRPDDSAPAAAELPPSTREQDQPRPENPT